MCTNSFNTLRDNKFKYGLYLDGNDINNPIQLYSLDEIEKLDLNIQYILPYRTKKSYKENYKTDIFKLCQTRYDIQPRYFKHLLYPEQIIQLEKIALCNKIPYIYVNKVRIRNQRRLGVFFPESNYEVVCWEDVDYNNQYQNLLLSNMVDRLLQHNQQTIYRLNLNKLLLIEGFLNTSGPLADYTRINRYESSFSVLPLYVKRRLMIYDQFLLKGSKLAKFKIVKV